MEDILYKEIILELSRNPLNKKELGDFDLSSRAFNPLCGDDIEMRIKLKDDLINDIGYTGSGCAISQAATSLLTDGVKGLARKKALGVPYDEVVEKLGIKVNHTRMKCATLGHTALMRALNTHGVH